MLKNFTEGNNPTPRRKKLGVNNKLEKLIRILPDAAVAHRELIPLITFCSKCYNAADGLNGTCLIKLGRDKVADPAISAFRSPLKLGQTETIWRCCVLSCFNVKFLRCIKCIWVRFKYPRFYTRLSQNQSVAFVHRIQRLEI